MAIPLSPIPLPMNVELPTTHEPLPAGRILHGGHFPPTGVYILAENMVGSYQKQTDMKMEAETRCGWGARRQTVECSRQAVDREQNLAAARAVMCMNEHTGKWREKNLLLLQS